MLLFPLIKSDAEHSLDKHSVTCNCARHYDKKTNKTESCLYGGRSCQGSRRGRRKLMQSCYCQDAMSTQKKSSNGILFVWGKHEGARKIYTGGHWVWFWEKNEAALPRSKRKYQSRAKKPDISVKPLHFKNEEICKMISACLIKRQIAAEGQELRPEPRSPYFIRFTLLFNNGFSSNFTTEDHFEVRFFIVPCCWTQSRICNWFLK